MNEEKGAIIAVIRIRGSKETRTPVEHTLSKFMRLSRRYSCAFLSLTPVSKGWLQLVKDYVTWAPVDEKAIALVLEKRGKPANKQGKAEALNAVFHLHPPRGGFAGRVKKPFSKGELGKRTPESMALLLSKML